MIEMTNRLLLLPVLLVFCFNARAQKQPQVQDKPVRAPQNVKIDGRFTEWANPFLSKDKTDGYLAAYNSASRVFYTVSNDDENLYLVVRGLGTAVANKLMRGGLVFTVSHYTDSKRKKAPDNVTIGYPIPIGQEKAASVMTTIFATGTYVDDDSVKNRRQIDSMQRIAARQVADLAKEIRISGIPEITDSVISIYNEQHIRVVMGFVKRQPIIELAIPLKYLKLSVDNPAKFSYNIRLNGIPDSGLPPPPPPTMAMGSSDAIVVVASGPRFY